MREFFLICYHWILRTFLPYIPNCFGPRSTWWDLVGSESRKFEIYRALGDTLGAVRFLQKITWISKKHIVLSGNNIFYVYYHIQCSFTHLSSKNIFHLPGWMVCVFRFRSFLAVRFFSFRASEAVRFSDFGDFWRFWPPKSNFFVVNRFFNATIIFDTVLHTFPQKIKKAPQK